MSMDYYIYLWTATEKTADILLSQLRRLYYAISISKMPSGILMVIITSKSISNLVVTLGKNTEGSKGICLKNKK